MPIDWSSGIPTLVAGAITVAGWWAVNYLGGRRDRRNKARELRTQHLVSDYRAIVQVGLGKKDVLQSASELETAVADIHLFGNPSQVELVNKFVEELSRPGSRSVNMDALFDSLRHDIRRELGLAVLKNRPHLLKISPLPVEQQRRDLTNEA